MVSAEIGPRREPATHLPLSQPTVSHHLRVLTDAGLLDREERGRWAYYQLHEGLVRVCDAVGNLTRRAAG